ncbi:NUDIX domain-containing protein [Novosphingobium panipatense]|jgi:8-oxo-dGTP diphosphatase|uniref:NUDIX domain-containing protein n=1 Tax=Novosphingobium TaxID=165696 RepID=UPI0011AED7F2|nr:NUDIX domain-containing protein [Novosphingobium sp. HII-3]
MIVVAAALLDRPFGEEECRVLIQQRSSRVAHAGLWEFPGGKVEPGEGPEDALARELEEELGVTVAREDLHPVGFASGYTEARPPAGRASARPIVILLYACTRWEGLPRALDAAALQWAAPATLKDMAMPPLDYPLAAALLGFLRKSEKIA